MASLEHRSRIQTRFLLVCWGGVASGTVLFWFFWIYGDTEIEPEALLQLGAILFLMLWCGIVALTLWWQIIEAWRWRCLLILVPWIWPPLGFVVFALVPVAFLGLVTVRTIQMRRSSQRAV